MVSYRDLLKRSSMLSLGVGSSYLTYHYMKTRREELLDIIEDAKLHTLKLYRKLIGDRPDVNYLKSKAYHQENGNVPVKADLRLPFNTSSIFQIPLTETSKSALSDRDAILSAVNEDLQEFKARIASVFQDKDLVGLRKLDELSVSIGALSDRILEAEQLLVRADHERDKKLILLCLYEEALNNRIAAISSYLKSVIQTFGPVLSIPGNMTSIINILCPLQKFPPNLYAHNNIAEDISALLEKGMLADAHDKLNQLDGIQRAIVKPAIVELRRLIEIQFLKECQKTLIL